MRRASCQTLGTTNSARLTMARLHPSNVGISAVLASAMTSLSLKDPWLLFQEGHCKTQLTRFLLPTFSFYESSNDHQKFWLINARTPYCKTAKPNGTFKGEKPDLRILGQGGHVATVEIKLRPSFGSSAQLGGNGIESDLEQLCAGSAQIFLLGATDHWWSRIAVRFPGLCPPTQSVVPSTSV